MQIPPRVQHKYSPEHCPKVDKTNLTPMKPLCNITPVVFVKPQPLVHPMKHVVVQVIPNRSCLHDCMYPPENHRDIQSPLRILPQAATCTPFYQITYSRDRRNPTRKLFENQSCKKSYLARPPIRSFFLLPRISNAVLFISTFKFQPERLQNGNDVVECLIDVFSDFGTGDHYFSADEDKKHQFGLLHPVDKPREQLRFVAGAR